MAPLPKYVQPPNRFQFEEPEGRPFRVVSVETEVDGDGRKLAQTFHKYNLLYGQEVQPYGYHPGQHHPHLAFLKYDGTVTGGELVFDRATLTDKNAAEAMYVAHEYLRTLEKGGHIRTGPNCGGHIHIDARGYGFYDVVRSLILFGHLEEPIYRLAGAGKTFGHRSLYKGRRPGQDYSRPVNKGPFSDARVCYQVLHTQPRHSGINTTIYAGGYCSGGCPHSTINDANGNALYSDLKRCKCAKQKFTLEWRVWNAQTNPRILYAWIALMQAFHAYCWRPYAAAQYKTWEPGLKPLAWEARPWSRISPETKNAAQGRVEWMFNELPLTTAEKDALAYAYMRTPYKRFGRDWFDRLIDTPYKAPPFPNTYENTFKRPIDPPLVD